MEIKPTGIKGFSEVYDDEGNVKMTLTYVEPKEKEKSAKEIFIDLDFKESLNDERFLSYRDIRDEDFWVIFDKKDKTICCYQTHDYNFDFKMLKAINKQVEELGWNNE